MELLFAPTSSFPVAQALSWTKHKLHNNVLDNSVVQNEGDIRSVFGVIDIVKIKKLHCFTVMNILYFFSLYTTKIDNSLK